MFTKSASSSFSSSNAAARNAIRLYNGSFYAIDIVSCHYSIFRPIPTKQFNEQGELEFNTDIENFNEEIWVTGGATIFKMALPFADNLYISFIKGTYEGDVYFPKFDLNQYKLTWKEDTERVLFSLYTK